MGAGAAGGTQTVKGQRMGIDATTLEANAAMRACLAVSPGGS